MIWLRRIFYILVAVAVIQVIYYYPKMPEVMASHFDCLGAPNDWSGRGFFFGLYLAIVLMLVIVFEYVPQWSEKRSKFGMKIPHPEYWLAPERIDQTRAFFLGRGFSSEHADLAGRSCVFQTIFRSDGKLSVDYDLRDWKVHHKGAKLLLKVRDYWDSLWETKQVSQPARIAFRWALLPTRQHYEPGDYNWGMTSFGLPPGETFGLALSVDIGGKRATDFIPGIQCASDRP